MTGLVDGMGRAGARPRRTPLNKDRIVGFWAAWAGWLLDGMDSVIDALVLVPALTELLPRSGIAAIFALGAAVHGMGTLGTPVVLTAVACGIGLVVIPFAAETRGEPLPR